MTFLKLLTLIYAFELYIHTLIHLFLTLVYTTYSGIYKMSAILDLLTRRVEEKGISKMILDIKKEIEEQEEIEHCKKAKAKFEELLRFYTYYHVSIPDTVNGTVMVGVRMNRYEIESSDVVRPQRQYNNTVETLYDMSTVCWRYVFHQMGEDMKRIPLSLYEKSYIDRIRNMNHFVQRNSLFDYINTHGILKFISTDSQRVSEHNLQYLDEDIRIMREHGSIHV